MFENPDLRTKVKICGITNLEDARFASGALVDYLGFIFYEGSPRYIEAGKAGAIINWLEGPQCVGVFVNQPLDDVNSISRQTGIDLVQLHGNESPDYCKLIDKPVIKAIHIEKDSTLDDLKDRVAAYTDVVDYLLFDHKAGEQWGGTGQTFDWKLLESINPDLPVFLSGGLNADNIKSAIQTVKPYAVDLSSSLEEEPGLKDFEKIEIFMEQMREIWKEEEL
jgi:phosphoribosylanthranilate isomerase